MKQRIITACFLLVLFAGMLFFAPQPVWALFCGLITILATYEFCGMTPMSNIFRNIYLVFMSATMAISFIYPPNQQTLSLLSIIVLAFWLLLVPLWLKLKLDLLKNKVIAAEVGFILFFPFWYALSNLKQTTGATSLLLILAIVWIADSTAYFVGKAIGKNKLAPSISPGKSWEGAAGGLAGVIIYTLILYFSGSLKNIFNSLNANTPSIIILIVLATFLTIVSIYGDLFESWLKRCANIKDSSNLLPGHGGVFDRIDALIAVLSLISACQILFL